jgi:hypothetical protein
MKRKRKKRATCGKGHNNWSYWISGTDGKEHRYCKSCRQPRAKKYSEQKKNAEGSHTKKEWEQKKKKYKACPSCKRRWKDIPRSPKAGFKITKDHIVPLEAGGSDYIDNIQPLCYYCNFKKGHSV